VPVGRQEELGRIIALLDEARRGRSGTLVVAGDPEDTVLADLSLARLKAVADMGTSAISQVIALGGSSPSSRCSTASRSRLARPFLLR
jgi:hypothetical protein